MAGIPQVIKEDSQPVRTVGYVLDAALDAFTVQGRSIDCYASIQPLQIGSHSVI